ncbi:MAG: hypothetical protein FWD05_11260, partial [Oscillospiraceae bacterium]|nr:hypothetical protein [Oscillospiraceae bacterium]
QYRHRIFVVQATWKNRSNACGLSRFYRVAWRQKDKARCQVYLVTDPYATPEQKKTQPCFHKTKAREPKYKN